MSNTDTQTGLIAATGDSIDNALSIPMTIGAGVSYSHNRNLIFGLDYQWMRWSKEPFPVVDEATNKFILKENWCYTNI